MLDWAIVLAKIRQTLEHTRRTLGIVWSSSRSMTLLLAALTLLAAALPPAMAYAGKRIVDAVVARSDEQTWYWVCVELGLVIVLAIGQRSLTLLRSLLGARLGIDINVRILQLALGLELRHFEDSEFYDKLTRARREASSRPVALITDSFQLLQHVLTLLGYAALLVNFSIWAVLGLVVATLPATIAEMRYSKLAFRVRNWRSPESRKLLYLEHVLANDQYVKEVKLFGLGPYLLERYKQLGEGFYAEDRKLALSRAFVIQALTLIGTVTFYGAYAYVALLAARGQISLGNMTLYVLVFRQGQQSFQSALASIGAIYEHNLYMSNLFAYLELAELERAPREFASVASAFSGIRFEDVGFRYPGKDIWALRHINLEIARGESLALVGENGAGKTTLIKLLTRLYEPTEGRVLLDGKDLSAYPVEELRARIGVVFQDFNQYQFRIRENVGFGSIEHLEEDTRVRGAIERGGASELVETLGGLETPLGRWFQEGTELSGGQWQKIALARAFMREQADILVLDEPTAALDAEAEHAVFQRFRELAKGRTTIVISHRFPTVRMAQRIVVLDHGSIVELGNHDELVALSGKYARMFELQAQGYR
jgi:ATP-binding cassette subfamily B protein